MKRINPGDYGAPQPFYFPFMSSYWSFNSKKKELNIEMKSKVTNKYGFEIEPDNLNVSIHISNMKKKFRTGLKKETTAINDLSVKFYENQVTCLLGHNGAGKTTLTFILCGIHAPDSGSAYILGHNIFTELNKIQSNLGFCPQHDILYADLTVAEHIELVASIKGYTNKQIKEEIVEISKQVGLENDLNKKSKYLSGGMKRRLSIAMSVTGGSKILILDEPTSGLDPYNRRALCDLIRKFKQGRTIIFTTHYMEEADVLSDRIAIMNHGEIKCYGSPLFLKQVYSDGYLLTLFKKNNSSQIDEIKSLLDNSIGTYNIETNVASELSVSIPFSSNCKLAELFSKIDENKLKYGIESYSISSPTIEQVFNKVGSIDVNNNINNNEQEQEISSGK